MKGLERELRRGTLELLLLRLMESEKTYGYRLVSELRRRSEGLLEAREGTLYPVLYRLEDQGHIEASWQHRERGVPRKYYQLTARGQQRLVELEGQWRDFSRAVELVLGDDGQGETKRSTDEGED